MAQYDEELSKMQLSFRFLYFVLVGVMAAATAAFYIDVEGIYGQPRADQYALGLRQHLRSADYLDAVQEQEQLNGADEDEEGEDGGKGKGKGISRGKGKRRGKGKCTGCEDIECDCECQDECECCGRGRIRSRGRGK